MTREPLDEFQRIRRFYAPLAGPGGLGLLDAAALVDCRGGRRLVVTADAIVEGVHYLPDDPPDLVARKLLRVNLSDLAAMAARPLHYLLTTALPPELGAAVRTRAIWFGFPARSATRSSGSARGVALILNCRLSIGQP